MVTTEEKYPQDIKLELYQDDCALIDEYVTGDPLKVFYNLKGNEYQEKFYVNLQAWKIQSSSGGGEKAEDTSSSTKEASVKPTPKRRGRPAKKADPEVETAEDLAKDIPDLADAPF